MAALTAAMAGMTLAGGALSLANSYSQGLAAKQNAEFQSKEYDINNQIDNMKAQDAVDRGDKTAALIRSRTDQTVGSQRAALAAQGIDVDSGTAAGVQEDTRRQGQMDMTTAKNNAWREAWGFKVQGTNDQGNAAMTMAAGNNNYRNTLLTGGMQAIDAGVRGMGAIGGMRSR